MSGEAAALTFLLQTLVEELKDYSDLKDEAKLEFQLLQGELRQLQAFLEDSEKMAEKTAFHTEKETQIRELVYDIQDTIEICLTKTAAAKTKNFISRSFLNFSTKMAQQVKTLRRNRVKPVIDSIGNTEVSKRSVSEQPCIEVLNMDHPNMVEKIVDFEDEERIIGHLMEPKDKLDVVSIIGMIGIGKSTLAWKIFQNETIVEEFKLRIWVDASQKLNNVLLKILKSFTREGISSPDQQDLAATVRGCLKEKKFLLVLDNVSTSQDWQEIKKILPSANTKGKVLVTSRDKDVGAVYAVHSRAPHKMEVFSLEKSWELLQLTIFGDLESCPLELEEVGKEIAKKCGPVPLIIVVIGGILRSRYMSTKSIYVHAEEWNKVSKNMNDIIEQDYEKTISKAVGYSYDRLPYELRGCFLSLGMFPENEEISSSTLTQLWMAEGFIRPRGPKTYEETAERMLKYFIKMNLLMVEKKHLDQIRTYRVHDMIRRFCISQAEKENVFRVMEESRGLISPPVSDLPKFYRLCLHYNLNTFLSGKPKGPRVRTFLCFCKHVNHMEDLHIKGIHKAFRLLRVLSCNSISFGRFPNLTKLILLKSITLSVDNLDVLPKQVSKLLNLQTLVVQTKSHSIKVNANIWKMIQLRHVKTKAAMFLVEKKNWKVKDGGNLQTLTRLSPESCTRYEEKLRNLKTLGVRGKLANILNNMSLEKFQNLENLKLENEYLVNEPASNPLFSLPQPHHFPSNLKKVTLSKTYLHWQRHMPILAKIESLEVLKLKDNAFIGAHWGATSDVFKHLQFLLIANTELKTWEASTTDFPKLRWLVLRKCPQLREIPGLCIANLEKLEIEHVKKTTLDSAKTIEETKRGSKVPFQLIIGPGCN